MRSLLLPRAVAAVALVAVLGAAPARADDNAQIEKAKDILHQATIWIGIGCFDKTNECLTAAEKELAGVDETGKAEWVGKIKEMRDKVAEYQKNWKPESWKKSIERQISSDEDAATRNWQVRKPDTNFWERSDAQLADSWNKAHFDAATLEELNKKLAWSKKKVSQAGSSAESERETKRIGRLFDQLERTVEAAKTNTDDGLHAGHLRQTVDREAKEIENVANEHAAALGADAVKGFKDRIATLKKEFEKNLEEAKLADFDRIMGMVQEVVDGKRQWSAGQVEGWFKDADTRAATCPQGDKRTTDRKARLEKQKKDFANIVATEARDELVKPVIASWESCKEYGKETEGWEQETKPNSLEIYCNHSPARLGCDKTEKLASDVVQRFFNNDYVEKALKKYPNDPELKKVVDEATALREKTGAKILQFVGSIVDEAEKLPEGNMRKNFEGQFYNLKNHIERHAKGATGADKMIARLDALEKKWKGDTAAGEQSKAEMDKKACESVKAAWPGLAGGLIAKAKKINGTEVRDAPGSWKGTIVHYTGGSRGVNMNRAGWDWFGDWDFVTEVDGVPVCGSLEPGLREAVNAVCKQTGIEEDSCEEAIGVIDGTCQITQRVKLGNSYIQGNTLTGIKIRIVGWRACTVCAVAGEGTNLSKMAGMKEISVGGSSAGGGGGGWMHRLIAWAMCGLLGLIGALAAAHGAAKFVPALQENLAKMGDGLGYAGIAFAVIGVLWFLGAILFQFIWGHGFSLPSMAMIAAGAFVGLDLLRSKGKLKPETASMIQPAGVVLGLGCFGAAFVHFLAWDVMFL